MTPLRATIAGSFRTFFAKRKEVTGEVSMLQDSSGTKRESDLPGRFVPSRRRSCARHRFFRGAAHEVKSARSSLPTVQARQHVISGKTRSNSAIFISMAWTSPGSKVEGFADTVPRLDAAHSIKNRRSDRTLG